VSTVVVSLAAVVSSARGAVAVVAHPGAVTAIRTFDGWAAWQQLDSRRHRYVLRVRSPAGVVTDRAETEPVGEERDPTAIPFDLGPDARGRPSVVVSRCATRSCALYIGRLPGGRSRRIAGTAQPAPPTSPTLWREQVAWVDPRSEVVLRSRPGARRRVLSPWFGHRCARRPGPWRCDAPGPAELELRGDLLAGVVHFGLADEADSDVAGVGLLNTRTGHSHADGRVGTGEGGQTFRGPAFSDARTFSWMLTCTGDPAGCEGKGGIYRRDLRTNRVSLSREPDEDREGWAPSGRALALLGPGQNACVPDVSPARDCRIVRRRLRFKPGT
jgi:hypothetical protein